MGLDVAHRVVLVFGLEGQSVFGMGTVIGEVGDADYLIGVVGIIRIRFLMADVSVVSRLVLSVR